MHASPDRRQFLRFGTVALGALGLAPFALARRTRDTRADACILLYMDGGPSHIDLWDMKPDAPDDVRGPFRPVHTSVPGITVCEHLPRVASRMHHLVQIRSVRHRETIHDPAVYQMLTGRPHPISAGNLTVQPSDSPHVGSIFGRLDTRAGVMPKVIELPETMKMAGRTLPGQNAGFLGAAADPMRVEVTPTLEVRPPNLLSPADVPPERLTERASLRERLELARRSLDQRAEDDFARQALELLGDPRVPQAFDLCREPDRLREAYGRSRHGQSVLLARRLVEAGARFVTVYWGKEEQDWAEGRGPQLANNPWDTHRNHFPLTKDELLPRADRALSALLDDLHQRGMLGRTLVVWMGDFGRTPKITAKYASRDHWPNANTVLLAGAGLVGGRVFGKTDRSGAEVTEDAVSPADLTATMLTALGVEPHAELRDRQGRPFPATEGEAIGLW